MTRPRMVEAVREALVQSGGYVPDHGAIAAIAAMFDNLDREAMAEGVWGPNNWNTISEGTKNIVRAEVDRAIAAAKAAALGGDNGTT